MRFKPDVGLFPELLAILLDDDKFVFDDVVEFEELEFSLVSGATGRAPEFCSPEYVVGGIFADKTFEE